MAGILAKIASFPSDNGGVMKASDWAAVAVATFCVVWLGIAFGQAF